MNNINAVEICENMISEIRIKADHNKKEYLWSFKIVMVLTLSTPILINISDHWVVSKLLPSFFASIASFLTAWIKFRKPESLWALYRSSQRKMENEIRFYQHAITPYDTDNASKVLITNVTEIMNRTHSRWEKLVPNLDDANRLRSNSTSA